VIQFLYQFGYNDPQYQADPLFKDSSRLEKTDKYSFEETDKYMDDLKTAVLELGSKKLNVSQMLHLFPLLELIVDFEKLVDALTRLCNQPEFRTWALDLFLNWELKIPPSYLLEQYMICIHMHEQDTHLFLQLLSSAAHLIVKWLDMADRFSYSGESLIDPPYHHFPHFCLQFSKGKGSARKGKFRHNTKARNPRWKY
jgi:hypothetical protein